MDDDWRGRVSQSDVPWLAVYAAPQLEDRAKQRLTERFGLPVIMPKARVRVRRRFRGSQFRWVDDIRPYFPRYMFSRIPMRLLHDVKDLPSVSTVVSTLGCPVFVPDWVVERIAELDGEELDLGDIRPGVAVIFNTTSPLAGLEGIVRYVSRGRDGAYDRVNVKTSIFGALRSMTVSASSLERVVVSPG